MATSNSTPTLFNAKSLQKLCGGVIYRKPELERELYQKEICINFEYRFEKSIKRLRLIANWRHMLNEKPFEKWFRKKLLTTIQLIEFEKEEPEQMIFIANSLILKILNYRKIFGIAEEALNELLVFRSLVKELQ